MCGGRCRAVGGLALETASRRAGRPRPQDGAQPGFLSPGDLEAEEVLPSGLPPTFIRFAHHSYTQMVRVLKRTAARCAQVAKTYSIGRSFDGKDLLVIEFSGRPGQHELSRWHAGGSASGKGGVLQACGAQARGGRFGVPGAGSAWCTAAFHRACHTDGKEHPRMSTSLGNLGEGDGLSPQ